MIDYELLFKLAVGHIISIKELLVYSEGSVLTVKFKLNNDDLSEAREKGRRLEDNLNLRFTGMEVTPQSNWWYEITMTFVEAEDDS